MFFSKTKIYSDLYTGFVYSLNLNVDFKNKLDESYSIAFNSDLSYKIRFFGDTLKSHINSVKFEQRGKFGRAEIQYRRKENSYENEIMTVVTSNKNLCTVLKKLDPYQPYTSGFRVSRIIKNDHSVPVFVEPI